MEQSGGVNEPCVEGEQAASRHDDNELLGLALADGGQSLAHSTTRRSLQFGFLNKSSRSHDADM